MVIPASTGSSPDRQLRPHSCIHCQSILLPGESNDSLPNLYGDYDGGDLFQEIEFAEDASLHRLGFSMGDLRRWSSELCEFASVLYEELLALCTEGLDDDIIEIFAKLPDPGFAVHWIRFLPMVKLIDIRGAGPSLIDVENRCFLRGSDKECDWNMMVEEGSLIQQPFLNKHQHWLRRGNRRCDVFIRPSQKENRS